MTVFKSDRNVSYFIRGQIYTQGSMGREAPRYLSGDLGQIPENPNIHKYQDMVVEVNSFFLQDSWESVIKIINYNGDHQDEIVPHVGPGAFNDPDMVCMGKF